MAAVLALFAGWIVDRVGRRGLFIAGAGSLMALAHALLAFFRFPVIISILSLGLGFAFVAASFWPSIAYIVPLQSLGIAYGVVGVFQNTGLATVPAIVSQLQPPACDGSYICVESLFTSLALAGAMLGVVAYFLENAPKHKGKRDASVPEGGDLKASLLEGVEDTDAANFAIVAGDSHLEEGDDSVRPDESLLGYRERLRASRHSSTRPHEHGTVEALREHALTSAEEGHTQPPHGSVQAHVLEEEEDEEDEDDVGDEANVWEFVGSAAMGGQRYAVDHLAKRRNSSGHH
jgi:hypothetical protein